MTYKMSRLGVVVAVLFGMAAVDAAAWGPRAQRGICGTALQLVRRIYPNSFKGQDSRFEDDLMKGTTEGYNALYRGKAFATTDDALAAFENEIGLLREMSRLGMGSYFAYRMGALSSFASDFVAPFTLDSTARWADLGKQVDSDIDSHFEGYTYLPNEKPPMYIRQPVLYFREARVFLSDNETMIADDYRRGRGYDGYLKEGGAAYFRRAVDTVLDTWHTVLRTDGDPATPKPSFETKTDYLVGEIEYLLMQKSNYAQAAKVYDSFDRLVKGRSPKAYEKVGDLFYAFGTSKAEDRGVNEWRIAYDAQGTNRRDVGRKIATHYIKVGDNYLARAGKPGAKEDDLPNALNAFSQALEYEQTNQSAIEKMKETNVAISERRKRHETNMNILASAEKVMMLAEKSRLGGDFKNAIATYNQAQGLFQAISDEFADQAATSKDKSKQIAKAIADIINQILDSATEAIDNGDKAVASKNFDGAFAEYQRVPSIVAMLPDDEKRAKDKQSMLDQATKKTEEAKQAQERWKQQQEQQAAQAAKGGGAAGAAKPAAGGARRSR